MTEDQFLKTEVLGQKVLDSPIGGGVSKTAQIVQKGGKGTLYVFRQLVGIVRKGVKEVSDWKSQIRFGTLDATGISRDLLKKGYHIHFKQLGGLEMTLKPLYGGEIGLGYVMGNKKAATEAVEIFNRAMSNQSFRNELLVQLKGAQEVLNGAAKVLTNVDEVRMAKDKALEVSFLIKSIQKW